MLTSINKSAELRKYAQVQRVTANKAYKLTDKLGINSRLTKTTTFLYLLNFFIYRGTKLRAMTNCLHAFFKFFFYLKNVSLVSQLELKQFSYFGVFMSFVNTTKAVFNINFLLG
jgi:hypothetical protein